MLSYNQRQRILNSKKQKNSTRKRSDEPNEDKPIFGPQEEKKELFLDKDFRKHKSFLVAQADRDHLKKNYNHERI